MAKATQKITVQFDADVLKAVVANEKAVDKLKAKSAGLTADKNARRIDSHKQLAVALADPKKFPRAGNASTKLFTSEVSRQIKASLKDAGVTDSATKVFFEMACKVIEEVKLNSNSTPEQVQEWLDDEGIDSENKLRKHFGKNDSRDAVNTLVDAALGRVNDDTGHISAKRKFGSDHDGDNTLAKAMEDFERFIQLAEERIQDIRRQENAARENADITEVLNELAGDSKAA